MSRLKLFGDLTFALLSKDCGHWWTPCGGRAAAFVAASEPLGHPDSRRPAWNFNMASAPRDGTLLLLLIRLDDCWCGFDDNEVSRTIGFNCVDNDEIDEWKFPGWSWSHDCIKEQGHGTPIAWAPMPDLPGGAS